LILQTVTRALHSATHEPAGRGPSPCAIRLEGPAPALRRDSLAALCGGVRRYSTASLLVANLETRRVVAPSGAVPVESDVLLSRECGARAKRCPGRIHNPRIPEAGVLSLRRPALLCAELKARENASRDAHGCERDKGKRPSPLGRQDRRIAAEGAITPLGRGGRSRRDPSVSITLLLLSNLSSQGVSAGQSSAPRPLQETGVSTR
jgi:hypothetical protein